MPQFMMLLFSSHDLQAWAKIELRRFLEYARLSLNWDELKADLNEHLMQYNLTMDDIDVYDYEEMENAYEQE